MKMVIMPLDSTSRLMDFIAINQSNMAWRDGRKVSRLLLSDESSWAIARDEYPAHFWQSSPLGRVE